MYNPLSSVQFNADIEDLSILGSKVYKQVGEGIKTYKLLIPNQKYGGGELNKEEAPSKKIKPKLKASLNAFNNSTFKAEDLMANLKDTIINKSIKFLLCIGPKYTLDKNCLPKCSNWWRIFVKNME